MSPNHILDLHGNPLNNCLIKRVLEKTQPNFAVIGYFYILNCEVNRKHDPKGYGSSIDLGTRAVLGRQTDYLNLFSINTEGKALSRAWDVGVGLLI